MSSYAPLAFVLGVSLVAVWRRLQPRKDLKSLELPPGPEGEPIIGHLRTSPLKQHFNLFTEWAKKYGDIVYVHILGHPVIVLNSFKYANELMEKRGALYSDRPRMVFINDMIELNASTFMRYGDLWRKHRRLVMQYFNSRAVLSVRPHQVHEVHYLLDDLLIDPINFWRHCKRFTASTILTVAYGYRVTSDEDPLVSLAENTNDALRAAGVPGTTPVDMFPFLRHIPPLLPGLGYQNLAEEGREAQYATRDVPFKKVQEEIANGTALPSMMYYFLKEYEGRDENSEDYTMMVKEVGASMYRAGAETTLTVLYSFILAILLHPEVAKKAQAELDNVLGPGLDRLPEFEDRDSLPYVGCVLKECLRWATPFPMGIAHGCIQEDELDGKRIPEGSIIMPNIWLMMHDERNYADPHDFRPERFMESVESGKPLALDPALAVFGFGRRICPGRHFADASLWLSMASILYTFDILPPLDDDGNEVTPKLKFTYNLVNKPKEYCCRFIPRNVKAAELIRQNSPKN